MSLTSTLLKAGVAYALGRLTANLTVDDLRKVTDIDVDDLKRLGVNRADAALSAMGLQRSATVPSGTALVLGGFLAGTVVGAGAVFLSFTEQGRSVRQSLLEFIKKGDEGAEREAASTPEPSDDESEDQAEA